MISDYEAISSDLIDLGIEKGDSVVLHSSFKSLGNVNGGIDTFIKAILSVLGDSGTLIVPTLSYSYVSVQNPVFDYLKTPSCVGAVSEFVRLMDGSVRSIHPTHSVAAFGRLADYYTEGHEKDRTPCGENSPFRKNIESGGKILMLGCNIAHNTTFHALEEMVGVGYALTSPPLTHTLILPDRTYSADYRRHSIVQNGYGQRYDRIKDVDDNGMRKGFVHGAECHLFSADVMAKRAISIMKENEKFFVEKIKK